MGKKTKIIIEDPILCKNYKYEKRKKQKQLQRLKLNQSKLLEQSKMKCIKQIQKKVENEINQMYNAQVQKHMAAVILNKKKHAIQKSNFRSDKSSNSILKSSSNANSSELGKNSKYSTPVYHIDFNFQMQEQNDKQKSDQLSILQNQHYVRHFMKFQKLPQKILSQIGKQKRETALQRIELQVKNQIKDMFKVTQISQASKTKDSSSDKDNIKNIVSQGKSKSGPKITSQSHKEQEEKKLDYSQMQAQVQNQNLLQNQPFVFVPKASLKAQKEITIGKQKYSASSLIFQSPNSFITKEVNSQNRHNILAASSNEQNIIQSYKDYVHVQNKEEQSIDQFRYVVVKHIHSHHKNQFALAKQFPKQKGFTMAKFLILSPFAGDAKAIVEQIQNIFCNKSGQSQSSSWVFQNKQKIDELDDENDFFRFGIKIFTKKQKLYYFANFDTADIIVASPLGLKAIINSSTQKNKQNSFLSSIQILYIDRASVMLMQNWEHLIEVLKNLNYMPKYSSLKNSINQIRESTLQMKGRIYRQSIVFSQFQFPELNALKMNYFHNYQGCLTLKHNYLAVTLQNNQKLQKNFFKIELKQPKQDLNSRFEYFKRKFWDKLHNQQKFNKIIILVNSYFEYIKLKSFLQKVNASAQCICEHTKKEKIQSRLANFNNNKFRILLLTQRAFYFGLCQIKKFKQIYFYSLPKNNFIYKLLIQSMIRDQQAQEQNKIVCIYSKYDKPILQRIVGSAKASQMLRQYCSNVNFII